MLAFISALNAFPHRGLAGPYSLCLHPQFITHLSLQHITGLRVGSLELG